MAGILKAAYGIMCGKSHLDLSKYCAGNE